MRNTWQAFLLARAGVAFDRLLVYGTGGLAVADDRESFSIYNSGSTLSYLALESQTNTLIGWAAGVGGEYAFTSHWTASVEVRYASFGKGAAVMPASLPGAGTVTYSPKFSETMALVGLSYRFLKPFRPVHAEPGRQAGEVERIRLALARRSCYLDGGGVDRRWFPTGEARAPCCRMPANGRAAAVNSLGMVWLSRRASYETR